MVPCVRHPEYVIQLRRNFPRLNIRVPIGNKSHSGRISPDTGFFGWINTSKIRLLRAPIPCFSGPGGNNSQKTVIIQVI